jgi:hypothetical protein
VASGAAGGGPCGASLSRSMLARMTGGASPRAGLFHGVAQGGKRVRNSKLQRLQSRSFPTRFGCFLDERSSLGAFSKRGSFFGNARARETRTWKRR